MSIYRDIYTEVANLKKENQILRRQVKILAYGMYELAGPFTSLVNHNHQDCSLCQAAKLSYRLVGQDYCMKPDVWPPEYDMEASLMRDNLIEEMRYKP